MDMETAKALHSLREQNQNLFEKLRSNQTSVRSLLSSLRSNKDRTFAMYNDSSVIDSKKFDDPLLRSGGGKPSNKIHLYRKTSEQPGANKSYESDLTVISDLTSTSTPVKDIRNTPKSILKGRQIIDDNVKVDSKYEHTPTSKSHSSRRNLNFMYSEMDDIDMMKKVIRNQMEIDMALDDSHRLRRLDTDDEISLDSYPPSVESFQDSERDSSMASLVDRRLLTDTGNDRQHSAIIRELSKRPKSIVFDENAPQGREDFSTSNTTSMNQTTGSAARASSKSATNGPLLGYDFIAGLLDNESKLVDRSDAFYEELGEFRRVNKEECTGKHALSDVIDLTRPISPEIKDPGHTCIHGFNINERLYPEPLNENSSGESVCPVCLSSRKEPTQEEPAFVRVSIPRSSLLAPYKIKPHRRRSFDDTDNVALSKHCLAGWECSQPSMLPTASTVDLKQYADGLKSRLATTVQDIENMTSAYKILAKPDPVLDSSRALRADVQYYAMDRSLHPLSSTAY